MDDLLLKDISNTDLVRFLLNCKTYNRNIISFTTPEKVKSNCYFIVDINQLNHPEDILSDELGAWKQTDTSKKYYLIIKKYGNDTKINQGNKANHDIVTIRRTYKNFSDNSLHKTVVSIQYHDEIFELVFVSYKLDGEPHVINVLPHGNSKSKVPYTRTFKSTKISIQNELKR